MTAETNALIEAARLAQERHDSALEAERLARIALQNAEKAEREAKSAARDAKHELDMHILQAVDPGHFPS